MKIYVKTGFQLRNYDFYFIDKKIEKIKMSNQNLKINLKMKNENPGRDLENRASSGCAVVPRTLIAALSTIPDVLNFHQTGKRLYLS